MTDADLLTAITLAMVSSGGAYMSPAGLVREAISIMHELKLELAKL